MGKRVASTSSCPAGAKSVVTTVVPYAVASKLAAFLKVPPERECSWWWVATKVKGTVDGVVAACSK
jgi:hypothetical protein